MVTVAIALISQAMHFFYTCMHDPNMHKWWIVLPVQELNVVCLSITL